MELTPAQYKITTDKHRFRVVSCGRRFGKTTAAIEEILGCAVAKDGTQIAYIAPTYQQARDIAWSMLKARIMPAAKSINESRIEIIVKTQDGGASRIALRGWESIETLRGQKFDFLVIDEVAMMRNFWEGWQEVLRPTLTDTKGSALFISTPKGYNHFYELYTMDDPDYASFHYTSYDNPFIEPSEIDKARAEMTEDRFAQEYMADFRKTEGLVYKEFDRHKHVVDEVPESYIKVIGGLDFGYTNPYATIVIGVDKDSHYWIVDEKYEKQKTTQDIISSLTYFQQEYRLSDIYPDPAEPDRIQEIKKAGFNCKDVSKDIVKGIDAVRTLFKQGRIHIHKRCRNLILELETYSYPEKKPNKNENETPIKENDHAVDALRYALYSEPKVQERRAYTPTFNHQNRLRGRV